MRILLVEDDVTLGSLVRRRLAADALVVDWVQSLDDAVLVSLDQTYSLVVLDRGLPDGDGLARVAALRGSRGRPRILLLTARGTIEDRVSGLDAGADDYLVKPFDPDELAARCRVLIRRDAAAASDRETLTVANLSLCLQTRGIAVNGQGLTIPRRELLVLECLMRSRARVVTRERLTEEVYGLDDEIESNSLEANISRLRKSLRGAGAQVEIRTVRGVGYFIAASPAEKS